METRRDTLLSHPVSCPTDGVHLTPACLATTVEAGMPYDGKGNKVPQHQQVDTRAQVQRKLTYSRRV